MRTITFTLNEFLELTIRAKGEYYPANGYGVYDVVCPSCNFQQVAWAAVGERKTVPCERCGIDYPVTFRSDCNRSVHANRS